MNDTRMKRQRNVLQQVQDRREQIQETARDFEAHPERYGWLLAVLATHALAPNAGILVELKSVPEQGCWVHYGIWLTAAGRFMKFIADEAYGARPHVGSGCLESSSIEDVTECTSVAEFVPGMGRSFGFLALEALGLMRKTRAQR